MASTTSRAGVVLQAMIKLHDSCKRHIEKSTAELGTSMEEVLALEADLGEWLSVVGGRVEAAQLRSAHRDFGLAFYALSSGLYRQAFSSLRSFLEVSVAAIYLSAFELKRRQWVEGSLDISWSWLTSDESDGIYSKSYVDAFCPDAVGERIEYKNYLKRSYRRCSEYIHGNVTTSNLLPESIGYSRDVAAEWIGTAKSILLVVMHCLMVRYFSELDEQSRYDVEGVLEGNFSHLKSVRTLLDLPVEDVE